MDKAEATSSFIRYKKHRVSLFCHFIFCFGGARFNTISGARLIRFGTNENTTSQYRVQADRAGVFNEDKIEIMRGIDYCARVCHLSDRRYGERAKSRAKSFRPRCGLEFVLRSSRIVLIVIYRSERCLSHLSPNIRKEDALNLRPVDSI